MEEVMRHCKEDLRVRVNEEEGPIICNPTRSGKVTKTKSKEWKRG